MLLSSTFLMIASCFHLGPTLLSFMQLCFASDVAIIQISVTGSNGGKRCLCNVCAGGAQSNNSVEAQRNSVTVVDFHSDVVISNC